MYKLTSESMNKEGFRYLNWSGRRYQVNQYGEIFDFNDNKMETSPVNGHLCVELEWVLGKRQYLATYHRPVSIKKVRKLDD